MIDVARMAQTKVDMEGSCPAGYAEACVRDETSWLDVLTLCHKMRCEDAK